MAHRSQSSSQGDNPLDPHYLPPHYREDYRLAIDALVEDDLEGYYAFLQGTGVVDFLCQPEVEHIKRTLQVPCESSLPELPYVETDADGSSDTYWPVHSDLEAPALDLGWPQNNLMGPTEVTTLVNPSDRNMPSIKEHARRLIKNAQQVIAVVMDMFTDIDLFSDLLDATMRNVAVYILLDEQNSHNFTTMVSNCKVNLERVHLMRVRTVPGTTYFCRTGKSFKGQMMDRFMLVDCRVVLTGNYSFMWSFEKIHRCMAHLFLGELVTTFDEEFRILYAQSEPMVVENALVPLPGESSYSSHRTPSFRNPRGCLPLENTLYGGHFGHPFGDKMNMHPFRRVDHFQSSLETMQMQMHSSKQSHKLLKVEQGRSMMASREMEMSYKRHSYAEGGHESYAASRQFMKHQVMNNLEEVEAQSSYLFSEQHHYQGHGPGSGRGVTDKMKSQGYSHGEKYLDSGQPLELEPPDTYGYVADYLSSSSSKDVFHDTKEMAPGEGVYGGGSLKRGNMGQSYVCQTSPTQLHPPDQRTPFRESSCDRQPQEPGMKQGLRKWRINSYLSAYEDAAEDPMPPPLGPDPFDEPPRSSEAKLYNPDPSVPRFSTEDITKNTKSKQDFFPRYSRPNLLQTQKHPSELQTSLTVGSILTPTASETSATVEGDKAEEVEGREPRETSITRQESFRSRINPMLQRSSRLRSSLIFRSSKLEESSSQALKSVSGSDHKENPKEDEGNDLLKSSVVAQILEKRRSVREPFDWSSHKRTALDETKDPQSKETSEESLSEKTLSDSAHKEQPKPVEREQLDIAPKEKPTNSTSVESLTSTTSFLNMNDPEVRLQYFKELAAKRKAAKISMESVSAAPDVSENVTDRNVKTPGISANLPDTTLTKKPSISITPADPVLKKQEVSAATDSINQSHTSIRKTSQSDLKQQDSKLSSDMSKSPSPVSLKEDILHQSKGSHNYNISRDKGLYSDATDTQKHELKKASSQTASIMTINEPGKSLQIDTKSSLSLNQTDSSVDGKAREVMKDPTQKLVSPFGTKDKTVAAREAEEHAFTQTVKSVSDISAKAGSQSNTEAGQALKAGTSHSKEEKDDQRSSTSKVGQSRYQASTSSLIYSSNLRDDTKVILEQISASNQSRMEQAKKAVSSTDEDKMGESDKNVDTRPNPYLTKSRFQRTPVPNPQDRDVLLKKMENMRKEKKVYSRFEMGS